MQEEPKLLSKPTPRGIRVLDRVLTAIALVGGGAALLFMTALSFINVVVMRKALNSPIQGAEDLLILTLVVIVAFSIPFGARDGAHIEIEILEPRMSPAFAKWSKVAVKFLGFGLLLIMSWALFTAGQNADTFGESTQQLLISFEVFYYLLSAAIALYAVVLLLDIWQLVSGHSGGHLPPNHGVDQ